MAGRLKLGQLLVNKKLITPEQLQAALGEQEQWGARLGVTLVRLAFLDEDRCSKFCRKIRPYLEPMEFFILHLAGAVLRKTIVHFRYL